ncbi:hypothetical protein CK627_20820 [Aeromonas dhakensis]|uniref:hypothetical protein n=1 Tax=Aeromonas dhakensis TaxID=196024 RepID=UPI000BAAA0F3|nr:hypothetical protein [Aeromonas dhakensis]ASX13052.1 hypothetical protein CK627_20820 [Aeromonas dhakensis]
MKYFFANEYKVRDEVPELENIIEDFQLEDDLYAPLKGEVAVEENPFREMLYLEAYVPVIKQ